MWIYAAAAAAAKLCQSCPTLCDPIDGSPTGSSVPGILQARILEWVAISFSSAWKWKVKVKSLSRVRLFVTPWTVAYQTPPSMGFSRQGYWSGVPLPSPMWIYTGPQINRLYDARNFFSKCLIYLTYLVFFWYSVFVLLWDRKPGNNRNNNSWSHWNRFEVLF